MSPVTRRGALSLAVGAGAAVAAPLAFCARPKPDAELEELGHEFAALRPLFLVACREMHDCYSAWDDATWGKGRFPERQAHPLWEPYDQAADRQNALYVRMQALAERIFSTPPQTPVGLLAWAEATIHCAFQPDDPKTYVSGNDDDWDHLAAFRTHVWRVAGASS